MTPIIPTIPDDEEPLVTPIPHQTLDDLLNPMQVAAIRELFGYVLGEEISADQTERLSQIFKEEV